MVVWMRDGEDDGDAFGKRDAGLDYADMESWK